MGPIKLFRRLLLLGFVLFVGALFVVDSAARIGTQDAVASAVKKSTHSNSSTVRVDSFPFLYDVTAEGRIGHVVITDRGVPVGLLRLDEIIFDASQVHFDRHQLIFDRKVKVTEVDRATITIQTHLSTLVNDLAAGFDVQVTPDGDGKIAVTAAGRTLLTINLALIPIVPACPIQVAHVGDEYTLSCTVSPVPPSVLDALSRIHTPQL